MRTLMMFGGVAMAGIGIFCLANGSAAFLSVAFLIGVVFVLVGIIEFFVGRRADFDVSSRKMNVSADGIMMVVFGAVILSGQITDDVTASMLFALWINIEGVLSLGRDALEVAEHTREENTVTGISVLMFVLSLLIFFNTRLFNIRWIMLIGVAMILLGIRRVRQSFDIEYVRPGFMTGNEERLRDAMEEEKRALAKAKEGIREQKLAQRRIERIKQNIKQEQQAVDDARIRKHFASDEKNK